jgi:hypothetical protein
MLSRVPRGTNSPCFCAPMWLYPSLPLSCYFPKAPQRGAAATSDIRVGNWTFQARPSRTNILSAR